MYPDLLNPIPTIGYYKIIATILAALTLIGYLLCSIRVNKIRKHKEDKYISTLLFLTNFYFMAARAVEFFYVPSYSDYDGIHFMGQFYLTFDGVAFSIFIIFVSQVFLAEIIQRNQKLPGQILFFGMAIVMTSINGILSYLSIAISHPGTAITLENLSGMLTITMVISMLLIFIISIIGAIIVLKILALRQRVSEHKNELKLIAIQVIVIILATLTILGTLYFFYLADDPITAYVFRIIKLIIHLANILLTYIAFIRPSSVQ